MTGGGSVFATLPQPMQSPVRSSKRVSAAAVYSVDSFAEYSTVAVGRQSVGPPVVSYHQQQQQEELFRDLFAGDSEPETVRAERTMPPGFRPSPGIQWTTGATSAVPFPFPQRPPGGAPAVPRLNLSDLVVPRPHIEDPSAAVGVNGRRPSLLGQVKEEPDAEEGFDADRPETDPPTDLFPPFRSAAFRPSARADDNNGRHAIEQETLRFLERLDLKAVLHTPRPEVDSFFPTARPELSARVDAEAEEGRRPSFEFERQRPVPPLGPVKETLLHRPQPRSARKGADQSAAGRLAHMESTYGTTTHEPRKATRETIERLANPIAGYSSTLQALPAEQRRRREKPAREAASSDNNRVEGRAEGQVKSPRKADPSLLDQLKSAAGAYLMAASAAGAALAASPTMSRPRGGQMYQPTVVTTSSNQVEDQLSSLFGGNGGRGDGKPSGRRAAALSARKQALKAKIRGREGESAAVPETRGWAVTCATFLTQHEDDEDELALPSKSSRPAVPPLQAAQHSAESVNRSRRTPRATATAAGPVAAVAPPPGSSRKRPSRPAHVVSRDRGDSSRGGGAAGRRTPRPPPRPSTGPAATASSARRAASRPTQRKPRDASPNTAANSTKPAGRASTPSVRGALPPAGSARKSTSKIQDSTPTKAAKDRPPVPTSAAILMGSRADSGATRKAAARDGRPHRRSNVVPTGDGVGAQEPLRGPRVRLVPSRRLSNGSATASSAGAAAARGGRRATGNSGSDSGRAGRRAGEAVRTARALRSTSNSSRQQRAGA